MFTSKDQHAARLEAIWAELTRSLGPDGQELCDCLMAHARAAAAPIAPQGPLGGAMPPVIGGFRARRMPPPDAYDEDWLYGTQDAVLSCGLFGVTHQILVAPVRVVTPPDGLLGVVQYETSSRPLRQLSEQERLIGDHFGAELARRGLSPAQVPYVVGFGYAYTRIEAHPGLSAARTVSDLWRIFDADGEEIGIAFCERHPTNGRIALFDRVLFGVNSVPSFMRVESLTPLSGQSCQALLDDCARRGGPLVHEVQLMTSLSGLPS